MRQITAAVPRVIQLVPRPVTSEGKVGCMNVIPLADPYACIHEPNVEILLYSIALDNFAKKNSQRHRLYMIIA